MAKTNGASTALDRILRPLVQPQQPPQPLGLVPTAPQQPTLISPETFVQQYQDTHKNYMPPTVEQKLTPQQEAAQLWEKSLQAGGMQPKTIPIEEKTEVKPFTVEDIGTERKPVTDAAFASILAALQKLPRHEPEKVNNLINEVSQAYDFAGNEDILEDLRKYGWTQSAHALPSWVSKYGDEFIQFATEATLITAGVKVPQGIQLVTRLARTGAKTAAKELAEGLGTAVTKAGEKIGSDIEAIKPVAAAQIGAKQPAIKTLASEVGEGVGKQLPEASQVGKAAEGVELPDGAEIIEVIGGRKKGVVRPEKGNPVVSTQVLIDSGIKDITVRPYKATLAQIKQSTNVLEDAGWKQWSRDKTIWQKLDMSAQPKAAGVLPEIAGKTVKDSFAGNIRLSKYSQDTREIIKEWAEKNPEVIQTARRGIRSNAQVLEDAKKLVNDLGGDFEKIKKGWRPGQAWNAEEITAIRGSLADKTKEIIELQKIINAGQDTTENILKLQLAIQEHGQIQSIVHGITAEAGRALRQFKLSAIEAMQSGDTARMAKILKKANIKDVEQIKKFARLLGSIDLDNTAQVNNLIRQFNKPKAWDYVTEYYINSILSGPRTHMINTISNTITALSSPIERGLTGLVDLPVSKIQGRSRIYHIGEIKPAAFGLAEGLPEGLKGFVQVVKTGERSLSATKYELGQRAFTGKVGRVVNFPTSMLEAADELFRGVNLRSALKSEAYRIGRNEGLRGNKLTARIAEIMSNPEPSLMEKASNIAEYRLFRQEPGTWGQWLMRGRDLELLGTKPLKLVIPFLQTPINLLKFGIERSPLGVFDPALWRALKTGSPEASEKIARILLGSIPAATIAWYAADGKITGMAPSNLAERDAFYAAGMRPYSIKIGNTWVSYQRLEPFNQIFSQVAAVVDTLKNNPKADVGGAIWNILETMGTNMVSQTWLTSVSDAISAIEDPETSGMSWLNRIGASFVPFSAALKQTAQVLDNPIRKPTSFLENLKTGIPGLSQSVPARLQSVGGISKRSSPAWLPITWSRENSPASKELLRLNINVGLSGNSINNVKLTTEQTYEYRKLTSELIESAVDKVVNASWYQSSHNDDAKKDALETAIKNARAKAKSKFIAEYDLKTSTSKKSNGNNISLKGVLP